MGALMEAKKSNQQLEKELIEKIEHYKSLTGRAIQKVKIIAPKASDGFKTAADYLSMAQNYYKDAIHFYEKKEYLTSLAAFSYAHAWLDAGVRAKLFDAGNDDQLFTLP